MSEFERGLEAAAKIADEFAEENFRMATDTIFADPLLRKAREGARRPILLTNEEEALSAECLRDGGIHSAMAHGAQNIAKAIRDIPMAERAMAEGDHA